jgi:teichuronic acid biosynthesis glycosyltransferase TuaH
MKLRGKHIFILGLAKYNSEIESTTFTLARHLAKHNTVFYIENPYTWKDLIVKKSSHGRRLYKAESEIDTNVPGLKVLTMPRLMSINWLPEGAVYRSLLRLNQQALADRILGVVKKYGIINYIYINSFNFYYPDLGELLSPDVEVYHCVDPIVFPVERKHGIKSESKLVRHSDVVICTSKQLYNEKIVENRNTHFIPNAADIAHSGKALMPELAVHAPVHSVKRPIVGYFGNIERRLDYELLDHVTRRNPAINFVFAGPVIKEHVPEWFYERANIHLIGPVPYADMPSVVKGFDVAVIPFRKDAVSGTIFPLKLFEYLGAGKPVVATDFNPDLADFTGNTVHYCADADGFSNAIQHCIDTDSTELRNGRLVVAAENTWEKRSSEFADLIYECIEAKGVRTI